MPPAQETAPLEPYPERYHFNKFDSTSRSRSQPSCRYLLGGRDARNVEGQLRVSALAPVELGVDDDEHAVGGPCNGGRKHERLVGETFARRAAREVL